MNSMTMYSGIQYDGLQSRPVFDNYRPTLSKAITGNINQGKPTVRGLNTLFVTRSICSARIWVK